MKTTIFYYTSTGNSLHIAKRIKEQISNCELVSMASALKKQNFNYNCDYAVFIYPVHCFGLPIITFDFIKELNLEGCNYIYCVAVSGGGKGNQTFKQINYLLPNYKINNRTTIKYTSNYIKAGRNATPERVQKCDIENEPLIDKLIEDIKNKITLKNNISTSKGAFSNRAWRAFFRGKNNKFTVNDDCIGCKICEKVCPISNIRIENQKPIWSNVCVDCMGCINLCPKNAINLGNKTIKKYRYKNKNIPVSDLFID